MVEKITQTFSDCIETIINTAENLAPLIDNAAKMIADVLANDGKIMVCGNGTGASDAQDFSSKLLNKYERERPSLPAIALSTDTSTLTAILHDGHHNEIFAKQIRALGVPDDVLLIISGKGKSFGLIQAVQAAHAREMHVIVLGSSNEGDIEILLNPTDIELYISSDVSARIQEVQRLVLHCLCDLIDTHLFGFLK